ncbi:MAG: bifunctional phosphopantothenoylcysteine decarboxylase/phosphopantothenate--cysteine ligase CoaBC, partial [Pseudomonadota bacterium]
TDAPIVMAPAMNPLMWSHPATARNAARLADDGVVFVGPEAGEMAESGEAGVGRLAETAAILNAIDAMCSGASGRGAPRTDGPLAGRHVLVTAGPTHEPIDPVRFIANRSSGKQGYAIAAAARAAGADVTLVSGPVQLQPPTGVTLIAVETAEEMLEAVRSALPVDVAVFAAAVADWKVARAASDKIKKQPDGAIPTLQFAENPDILATLAAPSPHRPPLVIGFAAETSDVVANAAAKRARKGCDWILANDVSPDSGVFGGADNTIHFVTAAGVTQWPKAAKEDVADRLVDEIATWLVEYTEQA